MRVLLAEDNVLLAEELIDNFSRLGYATDWRVDGRDVLHEGLHGNYDIIILDLGLPGKNGLEILQQWREQKLGAPVLILTARDHWSERIDGLKAGADDYLTKPFHPEELNLRIQALLRRAHGSSNQPVLAVGQLTLHENDQTATRDNQSWSLTAAEFSLLRCFMLQPGKLMSKSQLMEHLYDAETGRDSNVLEVHINHLRRKLGKSIIETRRGQGYLFTGE
jgi:two-component system OmpR family response regulator